MSIPGAAFRADLDDTGNGDAELGAQPVRLGQHVGVAEHHLCDPGRVAQVDEDDAAMIAAASHPARQRHLLPGVATPQRTRGVTAQHKHTPSHLAGTSAQSKGGNAMETRRLRHQ